MASLNWGSGHDDFETWIDQEDSEEARQQAVVINKRRGKVEERVPKKKPGVLIWLAG